MKQPRLRQSLLIAGAALAVSGSALGLSHLGGQVVPAAQAQSTTAPGRGAFFDALARQLGISTERLQQAMTAARAEVGGGPGEHGARGVRGERGQRGPGLEAAAQAIGITIDQLRTELPGKSLAQVATAHGKNPTDVANALKAAANQRIDQAVANGRMTAAQGAEAKTQIAQRIDEMMNRVVPVGGAGEPGSGFQGPGGFGGPHGRGGPGGGQQGPFPGPSSLPGAPGPRGQGL